MSPESAEKYGLYKKLSSTWQVSFRVTFMASVQILTLVSGLGICHYVTDPVSLSVSL